MKQQLEIQSLAKIVRYNGDNYYIGLLCRYVIINSTSHSITQLGCAMFCFGNSIEFLDTFAFEKIMICWKINAHSFEVLCFCCDIRQ